MKIFQIYLYLIPFLVSLYFIVHDFWVFMVISVPKYVYGFQYNVNPFLELKNYHYYPLYFAIAVVAIFVMMIVTILLLRKNQQMVIGIVVIFWCVTIYFTHMIGVFAGFWIPQTIYDMEEKQNNIFREKVRLELLECRQNCKK